MHPIIKAQQQGLPLPLANEVETKIEYHLKTVRGKLTNTFYDLERAKEYIQERDELYGDMVAPLDIYKVTTITEKL